MPTYSIFSERWAGYGPCTPSYCSEGDGDRPMYPLIPRRGGERAHVPSHSRKGGHMYPLIPGSAGGITKCLLYILSL